MSRIKLLLDVVNNMRCLADSIEIVAEAIAANETSQAASQESSKKTILLEEVRAVLAEKSQAGFTAEVRSLLEKHGAQKLSQIDPANYSALMKDAEELK